MNGIFGINRAIIWNKNSASKDMVIHSYLRSRGLLEISDSEDLKDYRERVLPTYGSIKAQWTDYGSGRPLFYWLNQHAKAGGVTAEVLSESNGSTHDGVFLFAGDNYLGLDYDYFLNDRERGASIKLEAKLERQIVEAIIDSALTNDYTRFGVEPNYLHEPGYYDSAAYWPPVFGGCEITPGTPLFDKDEISSRSLVIKTTGKKTAWARTRVSWLNVEFSVTLERSSVQAIRDYSRITPFAPRLTIKEYNNASGNYEQFVFEEGVLSLVRSNKIGDDERSVTLKFAGNCNPFRVETNVVPAGISSNYQYVFKI